MSVLNGLVLLSICKNPRVINGLKRILIAGGRLGFHTATLSITSFQFNQTIEDLDLSWNGLAEEGCRALQKSLPVNHTLKELDLTCNRINVFSLRYLLDGLEKNDTMKTLLVSLSLFTSSIGS